LKKGAASSARCISDEDCIDFQRVLILGVVDLIIEINVIRRKIILIIVKLFKGN
jgi:hypothetical protein